MLFIIFIVLYLQSFDIHPALQGGSAVQRIVFDSWYIPLLVLGMLGLFISVWLGSRLTKKYSQLPAFIVCLVVGLVCLGFVGWRIVEVISSVGADNDRA
ncbi:MAG: hypothetical protein JNK33_07025, partial [Candidatus Doudnabacteria bacterium]|nr:hypothetical protein [Candidatus Doudnabacteria bacterium]